MPGWTGTAVRLAMAAGSAAGGGSHMRARLARLRAGVVAEPGGVLAVAPAAAAAVGTAAPAHRRWRAAEVLAAWG